MAVDEDLEAMQLGAEDIGPGYRRVGGDIDHNTWDGDFRTERLGCVEAGVEVLTSAEGAADLDERIRERHEGATIEEHGVELTTTPGLIEDALIIHSVGRTDVPCWVGTSPPVGYSVGFHRSNVSGIVSTYTESDAGPDHAASLAAMLAERIEQTLAK